jgi:hypothetical protein
MNISKIVSNSERAKIESRYARINWNAHLVPTVKDAVHKFGGRLQTVEHKSPHLSLLSEAVRREEIKLDQNHLGDSITIRFGVRAIATNSIASPEKQPHILVEKRASLVFSQDTASGAVIVHIYPPSSVASETALKHYLVGAYQNPADLREPKILKYLHDLFEIDLGCSTQTAPSLICGKLMVKLQARATAIESGSAGIFGYAKYIRQLIRGLWYLYRSSHASP